MGADWDLRQEISLLLARAAQETSPSEASRETAPGPFGLGSGMTADEARDPIEATSLHAVVGTVH